MPVLLVFGLTPVTEEGLAELRQDLKDAVAGVAELALSRDKVTVFFPQDMCPDTLSEEAIVLVNGLFNSPERTCEAKDRLAERVGKTVLGYVPEFLVECFVEEFVPHSGFWSSGFSL